MFRPDVKQQRQRFAALARKPDVPGLKAQEFGRLPRPSGSNGLVFLKLEISVPEVKSVVLIFSFVEKDDVRHPSPSLES